MFWDEVVSLFTEINLVPAILLTVGVILCIIEMFVPGFGVFGITGSILLLGGIVAKMLYGGTVTQLFVLIFILAVILLIVFGIAVWSAKKGLLSKSPLILKETALPENYDQVDTRLEKLIGQEGITTTLFRPQGVVQIGDKFYDAISIDEYLEKGTRVKVVEFQGTKLYVKKS